MHALQLLPAGTPGRNDDGSRHRQSRWNDAGAPAATGRLVVLYTCLAMQEESKWPMFEAKMQAAGLSAAAIGAFKQNYDQLVAGVTGMVGGAPIECCGKPLSSCGGSLGVLSWDMHSSCWGLRGAVGGSAGCALTGRQQALLLQCPAAQWVRAVLTWGRL